MGKGPDLLKEKDQGKKKKIKRRGFPKPGKYSKENMQYDGDIGSWAVAC